MLQVKWKLTRKLLKTKMAKLKIEFNWNTCSGASQCISSDVGRFAYDDSSGEPKVELLGGTDQGGKIFTLEFDEEDESHRAINAARACPTQSIKVINVDTGEVLMPKQETAKPTEDTEG